MKDPVDHILRPALPWRAEAARTECGIDATKVHALTRPEFFARLKDWGQQRTSMHTCVTCANTAERWGTWDDDPRKSIEREIAWECAWQRGNLLADELTAIAALIAAHSDEFAGLLTEIERRRQWIERKVEFAGRSPAVKPRPHRSR